MLKSMEVNRSRIWLCKQHNQIVNKKLDKCIRSNKSTCKEEGVVEKFSTMKLEEGQKRRKKMDGCKITKKIYKQMKDEIEELLFTSR